MTKRPVFSSRLTTILTLIGVAVGLGNVWRFPYMMGKYGGSAFLLIYLLFTFLFALPALMGEISFGRASRNGPVGAFRQAMGKRKGGIVGFILLITILTASSYYAVVIANVVYSCYFSLSTGFSQQTEAAYALGLSQSYLQYFIAVGLIIVSLLVISRGLKKGMEQVSKIFVPFFLAVILFLIFYALTLKGSVSYFLDFLEPDFKSLKPSYIFAALGQAFYSLSLGGTFMIIYGSYLDDNESVLKIASWTAFGDVGAALLTSLFIVPTILVYHLDMTSGPTLIFQTLPHLFGQMPSGQLIGSLFLIALSLVAFLSLVAALEVANSCLKELKWLSISKNGTLMLIALIEVIIIFPSAWDSNLIGQLDLIFGSGMQVLGSGLTLLALTWGLGKAATLLQFKKGPDRMRFTILYQWMKWVIPVILFLVLIGYIYSTIRAL